MNIRSVRLELLRPGPPHNQLLSPLTSYIALCGDEPPETVNVPFEHYRLLRQLHALRRASTRTELDGAISELRQDVVRMLSGIRCLATSLAQAQGNGDLIEIELVLSANELALIPFEIAFFPGSPTRELAHREVVITRRSRRVPRSRLAWSHRPRILLISASPPGVDPPPLAEHVLALRETLASHLVYLNGHTDEEVLLQELEKFLVVLPHASEHTIQSAVERAHACDAPFTHVHVLAHGAEILNDGGNNEGLFREPRFGVALHDSRAPQVPDVLGGRRLFSALAGTTEDGRRRLPQVVTLATCDGANQGGVVVPSASVAHDIHDGGVPLVIASQFPLTFDGSKVFVKRLYERLLEGDDPRCSLQETRRAMHAAGTFPKGVIDWGAIVSYGSFPEDLPNSVRQARIWALRQQTDAALSSLDPLVMPPGRNEPDLGWKAFQRRLSLLERELTGHADDVHTARYMARQHLRWAFLLRDGFLGTDTAAEPTPSPSETSQQSRWRRFVEARAQEEGTDPQHHFMTLMDRSLRAYRDGCNEHYRATGNPISLAEGLMGDYFLGEPVLHVRAQASATECEERVVGRNTTAEAARKFARARVLLWVLNPIVVSSANPAGTTLQFGPVQELEAWAEGKALPSPWEYAGIRDLIGRQLAVTKPTDFEHFALRRALLRLASPPSDSVRPIPWPPTAPAQMNQVKRRATSVVHMLNECGVSRTFSAIVDWVSEQDGGKRTVAT